MERAGELLPWGAELEPDRLVCESPMFIVFSFLRWFEVSRWSAGLARLMGENWWLMDTDEKIISGSLGSTPPRLPWRRRLTRGCNHFGQGSIEQIL
jgi:hypothetical protein